MSSSCSDSDEDVMIAVACHELIKSERRFWVRYINLKRNECGEFANLFPDLLKDEETVFQFFQDKYFKMSIGKFYQLRDIISIQKMNTNFRKAITPEERLAVTLKVGCTALHHAVDASQEAIVELAITTGANLDIVDSCGWTPLTRGVVVGSDFAVLELLVNAKDSAGHSSLLLAVLSRNPDVTRMLLSAGATVPDPQALVRVAAAHQDLEIESLLKEHFALKEKSSCETRISSAIQLSAYSSSP